MTMLVFPRGSGFDSKTRVELDGAGDLPLARAVLARDPSGVGKQPRDNGLDA
jgi:hypothetical protein